jgi:hypothetical protein
MEAITDSEKSTKSFNLLLQALPIEIGMQIDSFSNNAFELRGVYEAIFSIILQTYEEVMKMR